VADKDIIIGRVINVTGMIGVSAGIVLLAFGIVLLLFRRGFGVDIANPFPRVLVAGGPGRSGHLQCDRAPRIILSSNEHKLCF
jgi:hypothetical protein